MDDEQFRRMAGISNRLKKALEDKGAGGALTFGTTEDGGVSFTVNDRPFYTLEAGEIRTMNDDELFALLRDAMDDFIQNDPTALG